MHWVNRGQEPSRLEAIRSQFTPRWVEYYPSRSGSRPTDTRWRDFHNDLSRAFHGLCAYCEEPDKGEVDHFRPVSRCPNLVYEWTNWVFACHNCNQSKSNKWPSDGYIDPCAEEESERPEYFFDFNTTNGRLIPKESITIMNQQKTRQMIDDLNLNATHHLQMRLYSLDLIKSKLNDMIEDSHEGQAFLNSISDRDSLLSSLARALLEEHDFVIDD